MPRAAGEVVHGIDVGTSTSSVMVGRPDGSVLPVRDPGSTSGDYAMPSAVCLRSDGGVAIGRAAEGARRVRAQSYRSEFKRTVGDLTETRIGTAGYRPDQLVGLMIGFLREQALRQIPGEPVAVRITVPAAWEEGNRKLVRAAAVGAGYRAPTVLLEAEPTAAAAYAFRGRDEVPGTVLVYDLGGGTFDCAVARATPDGHEVLGAPGGLADVGGGEFDRRILSRIRRDQPEPVAALFDPAGDDDPDVLRRRLDLRDVCVNLKTHLSIGPEWEELLTPLGIAGTYRLSRGDLAAMIEPLLTRTLDECERLLGTLDMGWSDVDVVLPVGGSSRLDVVIEQLEQRSGRPVTRVDEPELAVVRGAALLAAADAWPPVAQPPPDPEPPAPQPPAREMPPPVAPRRPAHDYEYGGMADNVFLEGVRDVRSGGSAPS